MRTAILASVFLLACVAEPDAVTDLTPAGGKGDGDASAILSLTRDAPQQRFAVSCNELFSCDLDLTIDGGIAINNDNHERLDSAELDAYILAIARTAVAHRVTWPVAPDELIEQPFAVPVAELVVSSYSIRTRRIPLVVSGTISGQGPWWEQSDAYLLKSYNLYWDRSLHSSDPDDRFEMTLVRDSALANLKVVTLEVTASWH